MSMPNRFALIERRLAIIEEKLGIDTPQEMLNYVKSAQRRDEVPLGEETLTTKNYVCCIHRLDTSKSRCLDCGAIMIKEAGK